MAGEHQAGSQAGLPWRFLNRVEFGHPWFYRAFDLPTVLTNWHVGVPAERIHLVTVPQRGADPGELFRRFCTAFGIDPAWAPLDSDRLNTSLGVAETQVIRQLNRRMDRATRREKEYDELIRELLAQDRLVHRDSAPVRLPPGRLRLGERAGRQLDRVGQEQRDPGRRGASTTCGRSRSPTRSRTSTRTRCRRGRC